MTKQQAEELYQAALKWQQQGARSKWRTKVSLTLWDTIERIKTEREKDSQFRSDESFKTLLGKLLQMLIRECGWPRVV
jgi:hypothetical protein